MPNEATDKVGAEARAVAEDERAIQRRIDEEARSFKPKVEGPPPQTGARPYPVPPFPEQHQVKPGIGEGPRGKR